MPPLLQLPDLSETGTLGVFHLKRLWASILGSRSGQSIDRTGEALLDKLVLDGLGLGLQQTMKFLFNEAPSFADFESWIETVAGKPDLHELDRLNAELSGQDLPQDAVRLQTRIRNSEPTLTIADLDHWEEFGYVILRNAVSPDAAKAAESLVWKSVGAESYDRESWYGRETHGIMVELIQHPALKANRRASRIHKAFAQLWETEDLWVTADRCGFHPPQREGYPFPGPDLHWDVAFKNPLSFGTQGILYLTDTPAEQGAFQVVPGFHHRFERWLEELDPGANPQQQDLHALGPKPIAAKAGDLVIWHHWLPHGPSPNHGSRPRIVQYINMYPGTRVEIQSGMPKS